MPLNIPGLLVPFSLIFNPRLLVPHISVKDIRQIDFPALRKAGYKGAIFDKDNCLTLPHKDTLVPELTEAWRTCLLTFGKGNVIVVSNSAGTDLDPGGIQAESVSHHLAVPVLNHNSRKPSGKTIRSIRSYFSSLPDPVCEKELVVVGDRLFTDVVLANRLGRIAPPLTKDPSLPTSNPPLPQGTLAIWTTGVWKNDSIFMRWGERTLLNAVERWSTSPQSEKTSLKENYTTFTYPK